MPTTTCTTTTATGKDVSTKNLTINGEETYNCLFKYEYVLQVSLDGAILDEPGAAHTATIRFRPEPFAELGITCVTTDDNTGDADSADYTLQPYNGIVELLTDSSAQSGAVLEGGVATLLFTSENETYYFKLEFFPGRYFSTYNVTAGYAPGWAAIDGVIYYRVIVAEAQCKVKFHLVDGTCSGPTVLAFDALRVTGLPKDAVIVSGGIYDPGTGTTSVLNLDGNKDLLRRGLVPGSDDREELSIYTTIPISFYNTTDKLLGLTYTSEELGPGTYNWSGELTIGVPIEVPYTSIILRTDPTPNHPLDPNNLGDVSVGEIDNNATLRSTNAALADGEWHGVNLTYVGAIGNAGASYTAALVDRNVKGGNLVPSANMLATPSVNETIVYERAGTHLKYKVTITVHKSCSIPQISAAISNIEIKVPAGTPTNTTLPGAAGFTETINISPSFTITISVLSTGVSFDSAGPGGVFWHANIQDQVLITY